ncbi:MAG: accessory Sec system protein Asp2 [Pseudobutyrivibrio sp.]|nr:accessory Sec system protein Asp2 [Pseudobutyrivibrio sp.]
MEKIAILFVAEDNSKYDFQLPAELQVTFWNEEMLESKDRFDLVILCRNVDDNEAETLMKITRAYCLFYVDTVVLSASSRRLVKSRVGESIREDRLETFLLEEAKDYFSKSYGEKMNPVNVGVAQGFRGSVKLKGGYSVDLEGNYGHDFRQILFWRTNLPIEKNQALDFWLEYKKDENVDICLEIRKIKQGSLADFTREWVFSKDDLQDEVTIENDDEPGYIFMSLKAKGNGKLSLIAFHDRQSHRGKGTFLVGGQRHVTREREEIFSYFDPGDLKPPLAVYFSGYKTQEGFEGYNMMRKFGCPFLLIADQRFEGGGFYMGSPDYENTMVRIIEKHMNKLGFYPDQVVLSGISMGSTGTLYYGCDIKPKALIMGKPLVNLGDIAKNERLKRPGGFATSLDLLNRHAGGMDQDAIQNFNDRMWDKVKKTDFGHTKLIVSYMYEDDYDGTAYKNLLMALNSAGVQVYGKGLHGRHNDNTQGVSAWFKSQWEKVLREDFNRR